MAPPPPAVGRLADDERVFVHVADRGPRAGDLRDVGQVASRVPFVDGQHRPGLVVSGRRVVERPVECVRVGRVGDHHRGVGRGALRDDEVRAGRGRDEGSGGGGREDQKEVFHIRVLS